MRNKHSTEDSSLHVDRSTSGGPGERVLHSELGQALLNPGKRETERLLTCVQVVAVISQGEGSVKADAPTESQAGTHKTRTEQAATWSYTSTGATVSHYTNTSFPFIV